MESPIVGLILMSLMWGLGWSFYLSPEWFRKIWVRCFGAFLRSLKIRRAVVESNLDICFHERKSELYKKSYDHLARLILEIMMVFGPFKRFMHKNVRVIGMENHQAAMKKGRGALVISSHVCNWEVAAAAGAMVGMDSLMVTKKLKPNWLHRAFEKGRLRCDVKATYEPRTLKDILKHLANNGTVGMVVDQYAGPPVGVRVPFFGKNVGTQSALAMIAKRSGAEVLSLVCHRLDSGGFEVRVGPAIPFLNPDSNDAIARQTAVYAAVLEGHVREFSDQWLWVHRRFKGNLGPLLDGEWDTNRKTKPVLDKT